MRLVALVFLLVTYATVKAMIIADVAPEDTLFNLPEFPTLELNTTNLFDFEAVGGPDSISEATHNIAIAIGDTAKIILSVILFIIKIVFYLALLVAFLAANAFTGFGSEAPAWLNAIFVAPMAIGIAIVVYKLIRSGDDEV